MVVGKWVSLDEKQVHIPPTEELGYHLRKQSSVGTEEEGWRDFVVDEVRLRDSTLPECEAMVKLDTVFESEVRQFSVGRKLTFAFKVF